MKGLILKRRNLGFIGHLVSCSSELSNLSFWLLANVFCCFAVHTFTQNQSRSLESSPLLWLFLCLRIMMSVQTNVRIITNFMCSLASTSEKRFRELEYSILQKQREFLNLFHWQSANSVCSTTDSEVFLKERFIKAFYMHLSSKLLM